MITGEDNIKNIQYFQVKNFIGEFSDHCCISTAIRCGRFKTQYKNNTHEYQFPCKFIWNEHSINDYQKALASDTITQMVHSFQNTYFGHTNTSIDYMVENLTNIYSTTAELSLKRVKPRHTNSNKTKQKPWFNGDLMQLKKEVHYLSDLIQKEPGNPVVRLMFFKTLKTYNKSRKQRARQFKQGILNKLDDLHSKDPKAYWNLLNTLKGKTNNSEEISLAEWADYFKNLNMQHDTKHKLHSAEHDNLIVFNKLGFKITEKEVIDSLKLLKNKKSVGLDLISNEMLKYSQNIMLPLLTKTFNTILLAKKYPSMWCKGYIVPIFKRGNSNNPANYRGITIFSCIAKLFNTIITKRIEIFADEHNLIDHKQIGFKKNSRTADHMFILRTLISKYTKGDSKLYTCFIDFKKAFDLVDHHYLLTKLQHMGFSSEVFELLKDMYIKKGFKACVKSNNKLSSTFDTPIGTRQGDPLSPILFKLFINDLGEYINNSKNPPCIGNVDVSYLMYADDVVLISQNETDLQKAVLGVEKFCDDWNMTVNTSKSKVLIFNRPGKLLKSSVKYKDVILESVSEYKYLGIKFHCSGKFNIARSDLLERSQKAMFKLMSLFKDSKPSIATCLHLFDSIVVPIITYGAEVCGYRITKYHTLFKEMCNDIFEKCHMKYCRYILGVSNKSAILGLYGELGRYPLAIKNTACFVKYWFRLLDIHEEDKNTLLKNAFMFHKSTRSEWWKTIEHLLQLGGRNIAHVSVKLGTSVIYDVVEQFKSSFRIGWEDTLFNDERKKKHGNKLRCYRSFKIIFECENYLKYCNNYTDRRNLAKLRISNHSLRIETGRYENIDVNERICQYCKSGKVENELHFLLECDNYREIRFKFLSEVHALFPCIERCDNEAKFIWLMLCSDIKVIKILGSFVTNCFKIRSDQNI